MNPLSGLYAAGIVARNFFYDRGLWKQSRLRWPVISIGNLSVGGAGKTPLVMALAGILQSKGWTVDVLSRGYGRDSSSAAVAAVPVDGAAASFGDEPLLIRRKAGVPVFVGASRYEAGLLAESSETTGRRVHLLDDGFQHRRLARDLDIVVVHEDDFHATLLPVGRLREPISALRRAGAVVIFPGSLGFEWQRQQLRDAGYTGEIWQAERYTSFAGVPKRVVAFCGIARPKRFMAELEAFGIEITARAIFGDHHRYDERDIARLLRLCEAKPSALGFVCTEKDQINLGDLAPRLQPLTVAPLTLAFLEPERVWEGIRAKIVRAEGQL